MILYNPIDGDALSKKIRYRPKTCFLMTQLGQPVPTVIEEIRESVTAFFSRNGIEVIDADSVITGRDFLMKIWSLLLAVPLGVAIIHKEMSPQTLSNIFYEVGLLQAYGKESLVVKTEETKVPSDFVRTEYLDFNNRFEERLEKFLNTFFDLAYHYKDMADDLENNPLLAIDYLRRAYLISGDIKLKNKAQMIFREASFEVRAKNSVEMLLINF